jgi:hypothetical protein
MTTAVPREEHWNDLVPELLDGKVVLFLGAGVNMFIRPPGKAWEIGTYLPSGVELAAHLASRAGYSADDKKDLLRVAQYFDLRQGSGPLYEELRSVLDADYPTTPLHDLIAELPALMSTKGKPRRYPLIITTNYDDVLERAFAKQGQTYDLVWYAAEGEERGKFWHRAPGGALTLIERPNEYSALSVAERPVILKIHGHVVRAPFAHDSSSDSYVITEEHYIEYLTRTDVSSLLPVMLAKTLNTSHFLFLGYGLRDWNLRVILHRLWGKRRLTYASWAVQREPPELDKLFWRDRDVEVLDCDLGSYVDELVRRCRPGDG